MGLAFEDGEAGAGAGGGGGRGLGPGGLTFEDQGAEVRQAPRHLSQGGPQQPRVFVATQLQELHPQQLRGAPGTQAQQPAAAPGVQVQAQAVPGQEKGCPWTRIRIHIRSVCSISCSSRRPGLLLRRGHRPPAGLGGWTCPSLPGRPAQAGPGEPAESGWGEGRGGEGRAGPSSRAVAWGFRFVVNTPAPTSQRPGWADPRCNGAGGWQRRPGRAASSDLCAEEPGSLPAGRRAGGRFAP